MIRSWDKYKLGQEPERWHNDLERLRVNSAAVGYFRNLSEDVLYALHVYYFSCHFVVAAPVTDMTKALCEVKRCRRKYAYAFP